MDDYKALYEQLKHQREREESSFRFMLLDHIDHLLSTRVSLPAIPLAESERMDAVRRLKRRLLNSLGLAPFPNRSPLRAECVGRLQRMGYLVEKVVFHPRPGFIVPAHLYLPSDLSPPFPGILYASGHFVEDGMMHPDSQRCCIGLAKMGFAVLAYEAMGQGERGWNWEQFRRDYVPRLLRSRRMEAFLREIGAEDIARRWMAWAWHCLQAEHGQLAPLLVGLNQLGIMVWESIRALDYMCSRDEIDSTRVGAVGASGGGQNVYYTAALDERVRAVVSICCIPSLGGQVRLSRGTNWWGGGDLCEQIPGCLANYEFADVAALILPRPLLFVVGRQDDGFPIDEARDEYLRLASFYDVVAPDRARLVEVDGPHGISKPMREAAYGWFSRWLLDSGDGAPVPESALRPEPARSPEMRCFSGKAPATSKLALTRMTARLAAQHAAHRHQSKSPNQGSPPTRLQERIRANLGQPPAEGLTLERVSQSLSGGLTGELLCLKAEAEIRLLATLIRTATCHDGAPLTLILHDGGWQDVWESGWVENFSKLGCQVAILDVRGTGPGRLRTRRPADPLLALEEALLHRDHNCEPFATDFEVTSAYLMLGRTLLGERVWDLLLFLDALQEWEGRPASLSCLGIGQGGIVALLAAALDARIKAVATWRSLASFQSLIMQEPAHPTSSFPFGVLREFDLPEAVAALAPRVVTIGQPLGGDGKPLTAEEASTVYRDALAAYGTVAAPGAMEILVGTVIETRPRVCQRLAVRRTP